MNRIHIDLERTLSDIDRNIFGGFAEHMGRCIYGGIYDPGSPLADARGLLERGVHALEPGLELQVGEGEGHCALDQYHAVEPVDAAFGKEFFYRADGRIAEHDPGHPEEIGRYGVGHGEKPGEGAASADVGARDKPGHQTSGDAGDERHGQAERGHVDVACSHRPVLEQRAQDLSLIHISEPTRLLSISYAVFCLKKKKNHIP